MSGGGPQDRVRDVIAAHGWAVVGVFPTAVAGDGPSFSYTVGLTGRDLPELAVYGLDPQTAGTILNALAAMLVGGGELVVGEKVHGVIGGGLALVAIEMTDATDLAAVCSVYGGVLAARQIVWPDAQGRMPWEGGDLGGVQPLLGVAPW